MQDLLSVGFPMILFRMECKSDGSSQKTTDEMVPYSSANFVVSVSPFAGGWFGLVGII